MSAAIDIQAAAGDVLMVYGPISATAQPGEGVRAIDVIEALGKARSSTITVRINSPGGSVVEGLAIYDALRADGREIVTRIDGMAASIASVVFLAGNERRMAENASVLIHDPWTSVTGTAQDLRVVADEVDRNRSVLVGIYAARTGMAAAELEALMAAETTMTATEALERGFATHVDAPAKIAACAPLPPDELARLLGADNRATAQKGTTMSEALERPGTVAAERSRVRKIMDLGRMAKVSDDTLMRLVEDGSSVEAAQATIMAEWNASQAAASGPEIRSQVAEPRDAAAAEYAAFVEAIRARLNGKRATGRAADILARTDGTLLGIGALWLAARGEVNIPKQRDKLTNRVMASGMHSTSDFPSLLIDATNKDLEVQFAQATTSVYTVLSRVSQLNDYRTHYRVRHGEVSRLREVGEGGEIQGGTFADAKESIQAKTYAIRLDLTRQALVNDSLGAFGEMTTAMALSAAATLSDEVVALLTANSGAGVALSDGLPIFHSSRANIAGSGTAITTANIAAGVYAIRRHKGLDGETFLNLEPSFLLVSPAKELEARQVVAPINASIVEEANPYPGRLEVLVEPRLGTGNSWYLFTPPAQAPVLEVGFLNGRSAPTVQQQDVWDILGTSFRCYFDFGCAAVGWRGAYFNSGA